MVSLGSSSHALPDKWDRLFRDHLPGYDPVATAAPGDWFDAPVADDAVDFFTACLVFIEGETAGRPFALEDWQQAIVGCLFGWKRADGTRRYRETFIYVPRKNGKTPLLAGLLLLVMFTDHEPGAQLASAAAEREQAALVFRHAAGMILRDPEHMGAMTKIYKTYKSIEYEAEGTVYKALSADADTKHGGNVHFVVVDEVHAHPNGELIDVLVTSTASRRQPMICYITTADYDRESVCNQLYDRSTKVRDGVFSDSSLLPVIYEAGRDDDWTDPAIWAKANPNLGVSVKREYMERECQKAQDDPTLENRFKRLHLNMRTEQDVRWMPMDKWDVCGSAVAEDSLIGQTCFGGLDLASRQDIAGYTLMFPPNDARDKWAVIPRLFLPEDTARERDRKDGVPYLMWARQGLITLTPGNRCDYSMIQSSIIADGQKFGLVDIGADRWNLEHMRQQLSDVGCEIVEFGQGFRDMSEPMKELFSLVSTGLLSHGGHPVLRWSAGNVAVKMDEAGNIKPDKKKSTEKIDPIVMMIMALGRAMVAQEPSESVYESRGILTLD